MQPCIWYESNVHPQEQSVKNDILGTLGWQHVGARYCEIVQYGIIGNQIPEILRSYMHMVGFDHFGEGQTGIGTTSVIRPMFS